MIRTQIYLPKDLYRNIDLIARREKKAKAKIIREALEKSLSQKQGNAGDTLLRIAKLAEKLNAKGPKDLSTNIDKYLYDQ
ncbi:ribbon-helix-helix protein, CopG family [Candidatus Curtissbacteria bacterium]|nr:ribbon-helix-helix protein, CopG family [Candidatus Curtissbacteria bacterium]